MRRNRDSILLYWQNRQRLLKRRFDYDTFGFTLEQLQEPRIFNELIGLPLQSSTNLPHALMPYQIDILENRHRDLLINKSNKIGITETINRDVIQKGTVGDCVGYKILLGSSQRGLAKENLKRIRRLFQRSAFLMQFVAKDLETSLDLKNGTEYITLPAEASAARSYERVKYVWWDETSHIDRLDDREIFAAASARRANTNGYLRAATTPRGQKGWFWESYTKAVAGQLHMDHREIPYTQGLGVFFDEEFIANERARLGPHLFEQEYCCKFITSSNAAIESELIDSAMDAAVETEDW